MISERRTRITASRRSSHATACQQVRDADTPALARNWRDIERDLRDRSANYDADGSHSPRLDDRNWEWQPPTHFASWVVGKGRPARTSTPCSPTSGNARTARFLTCREVRPRHQDRSPPAEWRRARPQSPRRRRAERRRHPSACACPIKIVEGDFRSDNSAAAQDPSPCEVFGQRSCRYPVVANVTSGAS